MKKRRDGSARSEAERPEGDTTLDIQELQEEQEALLRDSIDRERAGVVEACSGKKWFAVMMKQVLIHQLREEIQARHAAIKKLCQDIKDMRASRPAHEVTTDSPAEKR